jgi:caffeoyl-CoA O-methyltransferase
MADTSSRTGVTYVTPDLLEYLTRTHVPHDPALQRAFDTPTAAGIPAIMVGPAEGKLLGLLLRMIGGKRVVEIGTLAGYSTIQMARALPSDGHLWTCEFDAKHGALARENFVAAGVADRITLLDGAALDTLPSIEANAPFDAVFIDADKGNYDRYGRWATKHLRTGGLLLGDNAFFFGKLLDPDDTSAAAMRRFHEEAARAFDTVCVPTPDGLLVGIKR